MKALRVSKKRLFEHAGYEPHPGQVAVHRSKAQHRVLACGARWGKSTCAAMEAVAALLQPCESSMGWVVAPTYDLCSRVYTRVEMTLRQRFEHRIVHANAREHRVVVRNLGGGLSEMRAKSADNPVSLLGEGLDWLIIDEAARLKRDVWESYLSQRLVDRGGWALFLSTPRGLDWFFRLYKRGQRRVEGFDSWSSPSWANPTLDRVVIEAERERLSDEAFRQEYGAEFLGEEEDPCERCGYPDPDASGVVLLDGGYELSRCDECGHQVDDRGRTVWAKAPNGEPHLHVIVLEHRAPDFVTLPTSDAGDPLPVTEACEAVAPALHRGEDFFSGADGDASAEPEGGVTA